MSVRRDPQPPKSDWNFDDISDDERHQGATDPDRPAATAAQFARAHRVPPVREPSP